MATEKPIMRIDPCHLGQLPLDLPAAGYAGNPHDPRQFPNLSLTWNLAEHYDRMGFRVRVKGSEMEAE